MACNISTGQSFTCSDKNASIGGAKAKIWLGNLDDLDLTVGTKGFNFDVNGFVSAINFKATKGLYEFDCVKDSVLATYSRSVTEGKIGIYPQNIGFKTIDVTPTQRAALDNLANADALFVIVETTSGRFELFGKDRGLSLGDANERSLGAIATDDTSANISLASIGEAASPSIIFDTDYATTYGLIESYVL